MCSKSYFGSKNEAIVIFQRFLDAQIVDVKIYLFDAHEFRKIRICAQRYFIYNQYFNRVLEILDDKYWSG